MGTINPSVLVFSGRRIIKVWTDFPHVIKVHRRKIAYFSVLPSTPSWNETAADVTSPRSQLVLPYFPASNTGFLCPKEDKQERFMLLLLEASRQDFSDIN